MRKSENWDVVVVGAGPAGASCALQSSKLGLKTLLVERQEFPRDKVCGCTLNLRSLNELVRLGVEVETLTDRIRQVEIFAKKRRLVLSSATSRICARSTLDQELVRLAQKNRVEFRDNSRVLSYLEEKDQLRIEVENNGKRYKAQGKLLVIATGTRGGRAFGFDYKDLGKSSMIGLATLLPPTTPFPSHTLRMYTTDWGYVGIAKLNDRRVDVAAAVKPKKDTDPRRLVLKAVMDNEGLSESSFNNARWMGTPPLRYQAKRLYKNRAVLIGDAAFYQEPFSGEGISWALDSANLLVEFLPKFCQQEASETFEKWERCYFNRYIKLSRGCRYLSALLSNQVRTSVAIELCRIFPLFSKGAGRILGHPYAERIG